MVDAPSKIKEIKGIYKTTIKLAWRISRESISTEKMYQYTGMPTWERIYKRALRLNINDFRNSDKLYENLIIKTTEKFHKSITNLRERQIEAIQEYYFRHRNDVKEVKTWRNQTHPITKMKTIFLGNERCPLCHCADSKHHLYD